MDEIVLISYFLSLLVLFVFGSHGFIMVYYYNNTEMLKGIIQNPISNRNQQ